MIPKKLCSAIACISFAVIVLLAIPMCLLLGAIMGIWTATDSLVRMIERHTRIH